MKLSIAVVDDPDLTGEISHMIFTYLKGELVWKGEVESIGELLI